MTGNRFARIRTGQSYEVLGLIYFVSHNLDIMPQQVRGLVRDACDAAAGRSGNGQALYAYMTTDLSKLAVMRRYHIASETGIDRMVRRYYLELERRLRELLMG